MEAGGMMRSCQVPIFQKAELIEFDDRLNARYEITKKEGTRMAPRLLPIAAERINFPVIEKNYEKRIWGRKEQEFGFNLLGCIYVLNIKSEYMKEKDSWIKESKIDNKI